MSFLLTKLGSERQKFLSDLTLNNISRSKVASIALARVLSLDSSVPAEPVEDLMHYYRLQCGEQVRTMIDQINGLVPLDLALVQDLALKFYQLRYTMAHPPAVVLSFSNDTAVEDFFCISRVFDRETIKTVSESACELTRLVNGFRALVAEIKA